MIKGKTALTVFIELTQKNWGKIPEKEDFVKMGYDKSTYYRAKKQFHQWLSEDHNLDSFICSLHHCDGACGTFPECDKNCYKDTIKRLGVSVNE